MSSASIFTQAEIVITCLPKLNWVVANEVRDLGFTVVEEGYQSVKTQGSLSDCMKLNLHLRCANKVLFQIASFRAFNPDQLYKAIRKLTWERWIDPKGYVSVVSYVRNDKIRDTRFANLRVKDALVDRLMDKTGKRPDSGSDQSGTVIFLHWVGESCSLYFDTSGETISKHGYRKFPHKAPLHESLAASLIMASKWDKESYFINPMCGSGTLAIEAALMMYDLYPGVKRGNYGFMHINGYDPQAWQAMKSQVATSAPRESIRKIIATDISGRAIEAAKKNAKAAGVEGLIEFHKCCFQNTIIPEGDGVVMLNPEYGERLGEESALENTYREIGDFFKQKCQGKTGYIFTGNLSLAKKVGLRTKRRIEFLNAKIECRLLEYELYEGKKG